MDIKTIDGFSLNPLNPEASIEYQSALAELDRIRQVRHKAAQEHDRALYQHMKIREQSMLVKIKKLRQKASNET